MTTIAGSAHRLPLGAAVFGSGGSEAGSGRAGADAGRKDAGTAIRSSNGTEILISSKFIGGLSYDAGARVLTMEHGEVEIGTERGQACFCLLVRPCRRILWRRNGASRGCWADYRFR